VVQVRQLCHPGPTLNENVFTALQIAPIM
jgi:hypothetical protein